MKQIALWFVCLLFGNIASSQTLTISGTITDVKTGEALIGVSVVCKAAGKGTTSNVYGFYSMDVPSNSILEFSYLGYKTQSLVATAATALPLNMSLEENKTELKEVVITAAAQTDEVNRHYTGMTHLDMKQIQTVPVLGGERDVVKVLQLMPGVKKEQDGSTGMLVRGGSGDQNLVLLDDAPVYNASHLLGFFSVFNTDAIKDVNLYKGGFLAQHGGRLSSVMDIRMKEGNMKETKVQAGVGLLSARVGVEGPIVKDKISYLLSARRTYIDHMYRLIGSSMPFYFYDINAKINFRLSENNQFFLSGYRGKDVLRFGEDGGSPVYQADFANTLRNSTITARWNHVYDNQKLFQHVSVVYSQFYYQLNNRIQNNELQITSSIDDAIAKLNYEYHANNKHTVFFGSEVTRHHFRPNRSKVSGNFNESIKAGNGLNLELYEMAAYVSDRYQVSGRLTLDYGVRLSGAAAKKVVYIIPEPRLGMSYHLTENQDLKLSYARMSQYVNLVTGSSSLPSDIWYPVTQSIKPQTSHQYTLGYSYHHQPINTVFSAEVYYKQQHHVTEFREGTVAFSNDNLEQDIVQGQGTAYGLELLAHKKTGKINGWIGYTLAYTTRQFDELNGGERFYARYDRRHDVSVVANYHFSKRITFSAVFTFATGSRFTPIIGQYLVPSGNLNEVVTLPVYSKRNEVVLAASHRLDLSVTIRSREHQKYSGEWNIGAYNVYNQTQPFRVRIDKKDDGSMVYNQVGLFGFIPSISYSISF